MKVQLVWRATCRRAGAPAEQGPDWLCQHLQRRRRLLGHRHREALVLRSHLARADWKECGEPLKFFLPMLGVLLALVMCAAAEEHTEAWYIAQARSRVRQQQHGRVAFFNTDKFDV